VSVKELRLSAAALEEIRKEGRAAYPHEGCGALLGQWADERSSVERTLPLPNRETAAPRVRFAVSPADYMHVEAEAGRLGLDLVGFWHSHPDHPARPSATDRAYAWQGLLTLVLAVANGEPRELTAWEIEGPESPFVELPIALQERVANE
jgi:proteasome lid subunit RPN8/RPN11